MTGEDSVRILSKAFRPDQPGMLKHFRADVADGWYRVEGEARAFRIVNQCLVSQAVEGERSWPEEVTTIAAA